MIHYPNLFDFHAAPGTDVGRVISLMEVIGHKWYCCLDAFLDIQRCDLESNLPSVTLINHPCSWLENCYRWKIFNLPMMEIVVPPVLLNYDSFNLFVRSIYGHSTDVYGLLHRQYKSDICIRAEDLPWCLFELLESFEIEIPSCELPENTKRITYDDEVFWTKDLRKLVLQSEQRTCDAYEYF